MYKNKNSGKEIHAVKLTRDVSVNHLFVWVAQFGKEGEQFNWNSGYDEGTNDYRIRLITSRFKNDTGDIKTKEKSWYRDQWLLCFGDGEFDVYPDFDFNANYELIPE